MSANIETESEYREALDRLNGWIDAGRRSETDREVADLEAAIARYVNDPRVPAHRKGRPRTNRP